MYCLPYYPEKQPCTEDDLTCALLTALPRHFQSLLTEDDLDSFSVYRKAIHFVNDNPQLELTDADLTNETQLTEAAVDDDDPQPSSLASSEYEWESPYGNSIICCRCQKQGHMARFCFAEVCTNCGMTGHPSAACTSRSQRRRGGRRKGQFSHSHHQQYY